MTVRIITKYSGGDDDDNAEVGKSNLAWGRKLHY